MNPIRQNIQRPQPGDLQIIKQSMNPQLLRALIAKAKEQGISEADISSGMKMLESKQALSAQCILYKGVDFYGIGRRYGIMQQ